MLDQNKLQTLNLYLWVLRTNKSEVRTNFQTTLKACAPIIFNLNFAQYDLWFS